MKAETVHLFLNPTAGRGRAGRREPRIVELLGGSLRIESSPGDGVTLYARVPLR